MIVKVGEQKVDSTQHPIIVEFEEHELEVLRTLDDSHNVLYSYPVDSDMQKLEEWVERRINEDYEEDDVQPIHEGNGD
jgi:hypothetical protein